MIEYFIAGVIAVIVGLGLWFYTYRNQGNISFRDFDEDMVETFMFFVAVALCGCGAQT